MKPIQTNYNKLSKVLNTFQVSLGPVFADTSGLYDPTLQEPYIEEVIELIEKHSKSSIFYILGEFEQVRNEIDTNMLMPIPKPELEMYIDAIRNFYMERESRIYEDKDGILSCDFVHFSEPEFAELDQLNKDLYNNFLERLRNILRKNVCYIDSITNEKKSDTGLIWKKEKVDLIELVRAIYLSGSINNPTNDLKLTQAYKIFGNIFNLEIKNPEDLLRQRADSLDVRNFLEELLDTYLDDQKHLKKKREGKRS